MESVLIPDLLNIHVVGSMLDLIFHTNDRPSFAKTDFENNYVDLLYEQGIRKFSLSEEEKKEYESWKKTFKL